MYGTNERVLTVIALRLYGVIWHCPAYDLPTRRPYVNIQRGELKAKSVTEAEGICS